MTIGGRDVQLRASVPFVFIYRDAFGRDAIVDCFTILRTTFPLISALVGLDDDTEVEDFADFDVEIFLNLFWAFAKNADPSIPDRDAFYAQFDDFPVLEALSEFVLYLAPSVMASKPVEPKKRYDDEPVTTEVVLAAATARNLSMSDLEHFTVGQLVDYTITWNEMHLPEEERKQKARKATQADWDRLAGM